MLSSSSFLWGGKKDTVDEERECEEAYGFSLAVKEELTKLGFEYLFAENTKGGNDEARLCLKSVKGECDYDECEDYFEFIDQLAEVWKSRVEEGSPKLKVKILFAQDGVMIGVQGRKYFQDCWAQERCGAGIDVECVVTEAGN